MLRAMRDLSGSDMLLVAFGTAVTLAGLGVVSNMVMRENGFGVFVNGLLLVVGLATGAYVRGTMPGLQ